MHRNYSSILESAEELHGILELCSFDSAEAAGMLESAEELVFLNSVVLK